MSDHQSVIRLQARVAELEATVAKYIDHTADGAILPECDKLYCPHCASEVDVRFDIAYCWNCPNPDSDNDIPLPLSLMLCYSTHAAAEKTEECRCQLVI